MLSVAGPALSLVLALVDSGSTPDLELCIQKFHSAFGACLVTLLVECMAAWLWGHSTEPSLWTHPTSQPQHSPASNPEIPKHQAKAGFVLLVKLHTINCLISLCVLGLLSHSGSFAEAVVSQRCTLQNRGISTLSSEAEPFHQVPRTSWHVHRAEPAEETNSAHKEQRISGLPREILTILICECV